MFLITGTGITIIMYIGTFTIFFIRLINVAQLYMYIHTYIYYTFSLFSEALNLLMKGLDIHNNMLNECKQDTI